MNPAPVYEPKDREPPTTETVPGFIPAAPTPAPSGLKNAAIGALLIVALVVGCVLYAVLR